MDTSNSSSPPRPKTTASAPHLRDTWRPGSVPPRVKAAHETSPLEQRATPRTRLRQAIHFSVGDDRKYSGLCRNLSLGGVAIQTAEPAPFGSRVVVIMELDGIEGETRLAGTVRWSKPGVMGIQWDSLGARVTSAILRTASKSD